MDLAYKNLNKSQLTPLADRQSTQQFHFLILNYPFAIVINNYKSTGNSLDVLRAQVKQNKGFAYHPSKNIKIRAFKRLGMVPSLDIMNGLAIFIFFKDRTNVVGFLESLKLGGYQTLTYYSMLVNGHLVGSSALLLTHQEFLPLSNFVSLPIYKLNAACVYVCSV